MAFYTLDNFGGATPPPDSVLYPSFVSPQDAAFVFYADSAPNGIKFFAGNLGNNWQRQINVTDNLSRIVGRTPDEIRSGLSPDHFENRTLCVSVAGYVSLTWPTSSPTRCRQRSSFRETTMCNSLSRTGSLFAQDTWKATRSLTVTYGLRWEYNAAPSSPNGTLPYTVNQVNNFATMTVAPQGTPLWHPQKDDFAPRLGVAWQARPNLVFRAGAGIFYDLGYSDVADGSGAWPYAQQRRIQ